ncbi:urease accessory protein UreD [Thermus scotoductus]|nr:urease accessory protein UreD [Thermus scotoductus]
MKPWLGFAESSFLKRPEPKRVHSLEIHMVYRGGRTLVQRAHSSGALRILRPFDLGDRILLQLITLGPGLLDGDLFRIEVHVGPGAKALLVNQSAGKVHPGLARQEVVIQAAQESELEFYPGLSILFPQASLEQRTRVWLEPGARFGLLETWALGRMARGEAWDFVFLDTRTEVDQGSIPLFRDALLLSPLNASRPGFMEGRPYLASGFWTWPAPDPGMELGGTWALAWSSTAQAHLVLRGTASEGAGLLGALTDRLYVCRQSWGLVRLDLGRYSSAWAGSGATPISFPGQPRTSCGKTGCELPSPRTPSPC